MASLSPRVAVTLAVVGAAVVGIGIGAAVTSAVLSNEGSSPEPAATASIASTPASDDPPADPDTADVAAAELSPIESAITVALEAAGPGVVIDVDLTDDPDRVYRIVVRRDGGGVVEVTLDGGYGVVSVRDIDSGDGGAPIDPSRADTAAAAALAHVGEGRVVKVEAKDDDDYAWKVEIELPDGDDVKVELDDDLNIVRVD